MRLNHLISVISRTLILVAGIFAVSSCVKNFPISNSGNLLIIDSLFNPAPSALTYTGSPYTFTRTLPITTVTPAITGKPSSCTSDPALPAGLSLDPETCALSGTPTADQPFTNYVIVASNSKGSSYALIGITVNYLPPSALNYSGSPYTFTQNVPASVTPTVAGTVTSCTSSPALPAGLTINNSTCNISGTPTTLTAFANYTITASNMLGNTTATIGITVNNDAPSALSYAGNPFTFTNGVTITAVNPTVTGTPLSYSVSPALPAGLAINTTTGQLSGNPVAASPSTSYTVTATNASGSTTASINITVINTPPVPGGVISISGPTSSSLDLSWPAATDNSTPQVSIMYQVYYSMANDMSTPALAIANGTAFGSAQANLTSTTVTGLNAGTLYYVTVLAYDAEGNQSVYGTASGTTSAGSSIINITKGNFAKISAIVGQTSIPDFYVNLASGVNVNVTLSVSGMPSGVTWSFAPATAMTNFTSYLSISPTVAAVPGIYTVTINGSSAGSTVNPVSFSFEILADSTYPLGGWNWYPGSSGSNCNTVCSTHGLSCQQAGLDAYSTDSTCALAHQFSGNGAIACNLCGPSDSTNSFCFAPGYVDDPPSWPLQMYYNTSGSYACAFNADIRTRPICPCL